MADDERKRWKDMTHEERLDRIAQLREEESARLRKQRDANQVERDADNARYVAERGRQEDPDFQKWEADRLRRNREFIVKREVERLSEPHRLERALRDYREEMLPDRQGRWPLGDPSGQEGELGDAPAWGRGTGMANGLLPLAAGPTMGVDVALSVAAATALAKKLRDMSPLGRLEDYAVEKIKETVSPKRKPVGDAPALDPFVGRNEYVSLPGGSSAGAADRQAVGLAEAATARDAVNRGRGAGDAAAAEQNGRGTRALPNGENWLERYMREEAPKQWLQDEVRRRKANDEEY